jgi:Holliday junction resolvase RusA-like endonuclease
MGTPAPRQRGYLVRAAPADMALDWYALVPHAYLCAMARAPMSGVSFIVLGPPAPAGSKQAFVRGGKAIVTDASKRSRPWKSRVSAAAQDAMNGAEPFDGPVLLRLTFTVKRPLSHFKSTGELGAAGIRKPWPTSRPDALKLARAVEDALTGIVYRDDAQIVLEAVSKHYATAEGVAVEVLELLSAGEDA